MNERKTFLEIEKGLSSSREWALEASKEEEEDEEADTKRRRREKLLRSG